jgi:hypothetical protein
VRPLVRLAANDNAAQPSWSQVGTRFVGFWDGFTRPLILSDTTNSYTTGQEAFLWSRSRAEARSPTSTTTSRAQLAC